MGADEGRVGFNDDGVGSAVGGYGLLLAPRVKLNTEISNLLLHEVAPAEHPRIDGIERELGCVSYLDLINVRRPDLRVRFHLLDVTDPVVTNADALRLSFF